MLPYSSTSMKLVKNSWLLSIYLQAYSLKNKCVFQVPSSWSAIDRNRQLPSPPTSFSFNPKIYSSLLKLSQQRTYYLVNLKVSPLPIFFIRLQIYFSFLRCYLRYYLFYSTYFFLSFLLFPPIIINLLLISLSGELFILHLLNKRSSAQSCINLRWTGYSCWCRVVGLDYYRVWKLHKNRCKQNQQTNNINRNRTATQMSSGLAELMQKLNSTMSNQNRIGSTTTVNEQVDEMESTWYHFKRCFESQQKQQSELQFQLKKLEQQTKTNFMELNKQFSDRIDYLSQLFKQYNEQQASQFEYMEDQNKRLHEEHDKMHEIGANSSARTQVLENSVGI